MEIAAIPTNIDIRFIPPLSFSSLGRFFNIIIVRIFLIISPNTKA